VRLAETLQCPVASNRQSHELPSAHYLDVSESRGPVVREADVILMLECSDPWGILHGMGDPWKDVRRLAKPDVKLIHITLGDLIMKSTTRTCSAFSRWTSRSAAMRRLR